MCFIYSTGQQALDSCFVYVGLASNLDNHITVSRHTGKADGLAMSLGETVQFYEVIDSCHFQVTMKRIAVDGGILFVCEQALKTDVEGV